MTVNELRQKLHALPHSFNNADIRVLNTEDFAIPAWDAYDVKTVPDFQRELGNELGDDAAEVIWTTSLEKNEVVILIV